MRPLILGVLGVLLSVSLASATGRRQVVVQRVVQRRAPVRSVFRAFRSRQRVVQRQVVRPIRQRVVVRQQVVGS